MKRKLQAILFGAAIMFAASSKSNAQSTLLYFWDFNTFVGSIPIAGTGFASLPADYVLAGPGRDTAHAKWVFKSYPVTSSSNPGYCDNVSLSAASPDFDTVNSNWSSIPALGTVTPGSGFRARNPDDSSEILIYMPSTHYSNLLLSYGCELSSYTSGDSINIFSYSVDSGATWITSGAGLSEWIDSGSITFKMVSVHITGLFTYNNPKLVFRIQLQGRNTGTSGNNRFDNVSVQGDSITSSLSVNELQAAAPVYNVYPNPAQNTIHVLSSLEGAKSVTVTNVIGQEILKSEENGSQFALNIAELSAGVYCITVRENANGSVTNLKFEKK